LSSSSIVFYRRILDYRPKQFQRNTLRFNVRFREYRSCPLKEANLPLSVVAHVIPKNEPGFVGRGTKQRENQLVKWRQGPLYKALCTSFYQLSIIWHR